MNASGNNVGCAGVAHISSSFTAQNDQCSIRRWPSTRKMCCNELEGHAKGHFRLNLFYSKNFPQSFPLKTSSLITTKPIQFVPLAFFAFVMPTLFGKVNLPILLESHSHSLPACIYNGRDQQGKHPRSDKQFLACKAKYGSLLDSKLMKLESSKQSL